MTRQFPNPGPRTKKVQDPQSPTGSKYMPILETEHCKSQTGPVNPLPLLSIAIDCLKVPVPETERRKSHIDLIDPTHPLLPMAIDCLSYNEEDRPSAQELCHRQLH